MCLDPQKMYVALSKIKFFVLCISCISQGVDFTMFELYCLKL